MTDTTASEKAAAALLARSGSNPASEVRPATGERARLLELIERDEPLTDDESEEFAELAKKSRAGTLSGSPERTVRKRPSVAGDRVGRESVSSPATASETAAHAILSRGW